MISSIKSRKLKSEEFETVKSIILNNKELSFEHNLVNSNNISFKGLYDGRRSGQVGNDNHISDRHIGNSFDIFTGRNRVVSIFGHS